MARQLHAYGSINVKPLHTFVARIAIIVFNKVERHQLGCGEKHTARGLSYIYTLISGSAIGYDMGRETKDRLHVGTIALLTFAIRKRLREAVRKRLPTSIIMHII